MAQVPTDIKALADGIIGDSSILPRRRYVAVCDVLGFKQLIAERRLTDVLLSYKKLLLASRLRMDPMISIENEKPGELGFDYALFSDTVLVWSHPMDTQRVVDDGKTNDLAAHVYVNYFMDAVSGLMQLAFPEMPLRIGIAYGEVIVDKASSIYMGKPIVDAFLLQERQDWIGGACHDTCYSAPGFARCCKALDLFYTDIPIKPNGHSKGFALNWHRGGSVEKTVSVLKKMRLAAPTEAARKYMETIAFVQSWGATWVRGIGQSWFAPDETGSIVEHLS